MTKALARKSYWRALPIPLGCDPCIKLAEIEGRDMQSKANPNLDKELT